MNWTENKDGLNSELQFTDQTELAEFVLKLAQLSDKKEHHADLDIRYNKLSLRLISHDVNEITDRDRKMAAIIEQLAAENGLKG